MDQGIEYYEAKYRQQQLRGAAKQAAALKVQLVPLPELEVEFLLLGIDPAVVEGAYGAEIKSLAGYQLRAVPAARMTLLLCTTDSGP